MKRVYAASPTTPPPPKWSRQAGDGRTAADKVSEYFGKQEGPKYNLASLPPEIMLDVYGKIDIYHHDRIRNASKDLLNTHNCYIWHEFMKQYNLRVNRKPSSIESGVMQVLKLATEAYVQAGYDQVFCSSILAMMRNSHRDLFCPPVFMVANVLQHFYDVVERRMANKHAADLMTTMTLIKLIRSFSSYHLISEHNEPMHCRVVFDLPLIKLGIMRNFKRRPHLGNTLVACLTQLLAHNLAGSPFRRIWCDKGDIYELALDPKQSEEPAKRVNTKIYFTVHGSKQCCTLIHSWMVGSAEMVMPDPLPRGQFMVHIETLCKAVHQSGCHGKVHFDYGRNRQQYSV